MYWCHDDDYRMLILKLTCRNPFTSRLIVFSITFPFINIKQSSKPSPHCTTFTPSHPISFTAVLQLHIWTSHVHVPSLLPSVALLCPPHTHTLPNPALTLCPPVVLLTITPIVLSAIPLLTEEAWCNDFPFMHGTVGNLCMLVINWAQIDSWYSIARLNPLTNSPFISWPDEQSTYLMAYVCSQTVQL